MRLVILILLLSLPIVYGDLSYENIHIPEGAIDTTHCPCDIDIEGNIEAQTAACTACIQSVVEAWAATQEGGKELEGESQSILETEHRQDAEIRRLNKLRKKARLQQVARVQAQEQQLKGSLDKLKGTGLTTEEFKNLLRTIDSLVYEKRYDINAIKGLKALKSELINQYEKRQSERAAKQKKQIYDQAVGKLIEGITEKAIRGEMDETFPLALQAFKEKGELTAKDLVQIEEALKHLDDIVDKSMDANGDDKTINEYLDLMVEFENLRPGDQIPDEQKQEESYRQDASDELKRKRIIKQPGPELAKKINRANTYYERTKKTRSEINELGIKANNAKSSKELNEINVQLNVLHSQQSQQDRAARAKYTDILKEDSNNIYANYAMSEILRREGKHWEAQTARARAMLHATPEIRKEMNENEKRKFLKALQIHNPTKESTFIKSMKSDFRSEYVEPVEAEQEDKDTIEQSTIISKALEWAWKRAKPLRTEVKDVTGIDVRGTNE